MTSIQSAALLLGVAAFGTAGPALAHPGGGFGPFHVHVHEQVFGALSGHGADIAALLLAMTMLPLSGIALRRGLTAWQRRAGAGRAAS